MFGPKREEEAEGWRRLHSEELHNLYTSSNIIRVIESKRMRWVGHVAFIEGMRSAYNILVGKTKGKILLGRPRHRWEDNMIMYLREMGVEWMHLAEDTDQWWALVNTIMNHRVP
jgi:hypothetical protein